MSSTPDQSGMMAAIEHIFKHQQSQSAQQQALLQQLLNGAVAPPTQSTPTVAPKEEAPGRGDLRFYFKAEKKEGPNASSVLKKEPSASLSLSELSAQLQAGNPSVVPKPEPGRSSTGSASSNGQSQVTPEQMVMILLERVQSLEKELEKKTEAEKKTCGAGVAWPPAPDSLGHRFYLVGDRVMKGGINGGKAVLASGVSAAKAVLREGSSWDQNTSEEDVKGFSDLYEAVLHFFAGHKGRYVLQLRR